MSEWLKALEIKEEVPKAEEKPKIIIKTITEKLPYEIELKIYELYKSYKSRYCFNEDVKKNRRTQPKQQVISKINEYFKFESKEEEPK